MSRFFCCTSGSIWLSRRRLSDPSLGPERVLNRKRGARIVIEETIKPRLTDLLGRTRRLGALLCQLLAVAVGRLEEIMRRTAVRTVQLLAVAILVSAVVACGSDSGKSVRT